MRGPVVVAVDETAAGDVDVDRWERLAQRALVAEGVGAGELSLLFVDPAAMAELHLTHLDEPGPTDVLSFPLDVPAPLEDPAAPGGRAGAPVLLGDVVVCPAVAAAQAPDHVRAAADDDPGHDGGVADEVALLVVHGVLHVLGHDHAEPAEAAVMAARERALLLAHHR